MNGTEFIFRSTAHNIIIVIIINMRSHRPLISQKHSARVLAIFFACLAHAVPRVAQQHIQLCGACTHIYSHKHAFPYVYAHTHTRHTYIYMGHPVLCPPCVLRINAGLLMTIAEPGRCVVRYVVLGCVRSSQRNVAALTRARYVVDDVRRA